MTSGGPAPEGDRPLGGRFQPGGPGEPAMSPVRRTTVRRVMPVSMQSDAPWDAGAGRFPVHDREVR